MQRLRALPKPYLIVLATAFIAAAAVLFTTADAVLTAGLDPELADKDFANYWVASRLLLAGEAQDLFGPWAIYFGHLRETFGSDYPWHNWSYPPHFLLMIWPLGFFGYKAALLLFLAATGVLFLYAYRAFVDERNLVAWIAVAPFAVLNFWAAQNGYLCAALALGALALRERRPVTAGVLLGLLTVKPQLGVLFPFLLLAERRWIVIASATVSTFALVATSAAIFGFETWRGYFQYVLPYQTFVMQDIKGATLAMMPSVYATLRNWHVEPGLALAGHLAVAIPVALIVIVGFFRLSCRHDRSVLLLIGTFIVTPYALTYDLGLFAAAIGLMAAKHGSTSPDDSIRAAVLALAALVPLLMIPLGLMRVPLATAIIFAVFLVALRDAGFMDALCRREAVDAPTAPSPSTVTADLP